MSAPIGFSRQGLPLGVQIIGSYLHDHLVIDFAAQLAKFHGGYHVPPMAM